MQDQGSRRFHIRHALIGVLVACLGLTACGGGGGSGDATTLLRQTFSGSHQVNSGRLAFAVTVQPSASGPLKTPLVLSFGGPFQSLGKGKLPQSNFVISLSALGRTIAFGIVSTGTAGYVSFQGTSYQLPQAEFQKLESSFSSLASSPGGTQGSGILGKLGIQPLTWLRDPHVIGDETVNGAATTHIRATINVSVLLRDFNTFLARASGLGVSGAASFPHGLGQSTIDQISGEVRNPSFDVWTGKSDKTLRRLVIGLNAPVPSQVSSLLGSRAGFGLTMSYANLNQPQTIMAPTSVAPFSQFSAKVRSFISGLLGGALSGAGSSSGGGGSSGGGSSGSSASSLNAYSQCIQSAQGDVAKMQTCASLLGK